jgi:ABC-2 type transport system ATP-binding protein
MIKVQNLTKSFGPKKAVDDVSFEVGKGEVLGFLGPNGAGKSTTMRMITGFIPPSAGRVSVCGFDVVDRAIDAKRKIGYLPEAAPSYHEMTVLSFLNFAAEIRGLRGDERRRSVGKAVDACSLQSVLNQTIDTLSKGFKHRTCLAQSIVHDPEVLILDEPTDGLDPNQKHEVRTLIKRMGTNKAIVFSTHILEEVEAACTRAIIIDRGRIVANGTPQELKDRAENAGAVSVVLTGPGPDVMNARLASMEGVRKAQILESDAPRVLIRVFPDKARTDGYTLAGAIAETAVREGWKIEQLQTEEGKLDDVFRSITLSDTEALKSAALKSEQRAA